jgi:hypothetical protein
MQHEHANIYRWDVSGQLTKAEFDHCQASIAAEIERVGPVRLLFVLSQFEGWEKNPNWGDMSFYLAHGNSIDRIAIVADERWRTETLMFAAAGLRKAPVEFFCSLNALAEARGWLAA